MPTAHALPRPLSASHPFLLFLAIALAPLVLAAAALGPLFEKDAR